MDTPSTIPLTIFAVGDVLLERYSQTAGFRSPPEAHAHEEVQFGLNVNIGGCYRYRGGLHSIGPGQMAHFASGERHRPGDGRAAPPGGEYRTLYLPSGRWETIQRRIGVSTTGGQGLKQPIIDAPNVAHRFLRLHLLAEQGERGLRIDGLVESLLLALAVTVHKREPARSTPCTRRLKTARDYIDAHAEGTVALSELAAAAQLSPARLCRTFSDFFGVPPHRYQLAVRISRAKRLLLDGRSVAQVALETGFSDQAHLTRVFRHLVGVTPGRFSAGVAAARRPIPPQICSEPPKRRQERSI